MAGGRGGQIPSSAPVIALERLSPLERAAFLLHDVFGVSLDEVATTLDRGGPPVGRQGAQARAGRASTLIKPVGEATGDVGAGIAALLNA